MPGRGLRGHACRAPGPAALRRANRNAGITVRCTDAARRRAHRRRPRRPPAAGRGGWPPQRRRPRFDPGAPRTVTHGARGASLPAGLKLPRPRRSTRVVRYITSRSRRRRARCEAPRRRVDPAGKWVARAPRRRSHVILRLPRSTSRGHRPSDLPRGRRSGCPPEAPRAAGALIPGGGRLTTGGRPRRPQTGSAERPPEAVTDGLDCDALPPECRARSADSARNQRGRLEFRGVSAPRL